MNVKSYEKPWMSNHLRVLVSPLQNPQKRVMLLPHEFSPGGCQHDEGGSAGSPPTEALSSIQWWKAQSKWKITVSTFTGGASSESLGSLAFIMYIQIAHVSDSLKRLNRKIKTPALMQILNTAWNLDSVVSADEKIPSDELGLPPCWYCCQPGRISSKA